MENIKNPSYQTIGKIRSYLHIRSYNSYLNEIELAEIEWSKRNQVCFFQIISANVNGVDARGYRLRLSLFKLTDYLECQRCYKKRPLQLSIYLREHYCTYFCCNWTIPTVLEAGYKSNCHSNESSWKAGRQWHIPRLEWTWFPPQFSPEMFLQVHSKTLSPPKISSYLGL